MNVPYNDLRSQKKFSELAIDLIDDLSSQTRDIICELLIDRKDVPEDIAQSLKLFQNQVETDLQFVEQAYSSKNDIKHVVSQSDVNKNKEAGCDQDFSLANPGNHSHKSTESNIATRSIDSSPYVNSFHDMMENIYSETKPQLNPDLAPVVHEPIPDSLLVESISPTIPDGLIIDDGGDEIGDEALTAAEKTPSTPANQVEDPDAERLISQNIGILSYTEGRPFSSQEVMDNQKRLKNSESDAVDESLNVDLEDVENQESSDLHLLHPSARTIQNLSPIDEMMAIAGDHTKKLNRDVKIMLFSIARQLPRMVKLLARRHDVYPKELVPYFFDLDSFSRRRIAVDLSYRTRKDHNLSQPSESSWNEKASRLLVALYEEDRDIAVNELVEQFSFTPDKAKRFVADQSGEALIVLLKAIGFGDTSIASAILRSLRIVHRDRNIFRGMVNFSKQINQLAAIEIIENWQTPHVNSTVAVVLKSSHQTSGNDQNSFLHHDDAIGKRVGLGVHQQQVLVAERFERNRIHRAAKGNEDKPEFRPAIRK